MHDAHKVFFIVCHILTSVLRDHNAKEVVKCIKVGFKHFPFL